MPFENKNCAVKAGQSVRAELMTPARTAIVLSRQAVKGSPDTAYVFTVQDNVIVRKSVSVRDIDINRIEILSGLVVSDIVVLSSSTSLQNGMKVTIDNS
jgi:multidrug efflux pump subunit AcrA (membrane-fusion protein)